MLPDSDEDEIVAIFWSLYDSDVLQKGLESPFECQSGVIVVKSEYLNDKKLRDWKLDIVDSELSLLNAIIDVVQELDPDIAPPGGRLVD